ncbi:MAG: type II toxin-antitoxin system VapC family toxin [Nocardioides sp.]
MIILDASALVDVLVSERLGPRVQGHLEREQSVAAPELIHVEVASALWRMERAGDLASDVALSALTHARTFNLTAVAHRDLMGRAWRFREHVRISDAFYLACADLMGAPLLTTDARLARGHHGVPVTLIT